MNPSNFVPRVRPWVGNVIERHYGVDTSEHVSSSELGFGSADRYGYEPSGWLALHVALPNTMVTGDDVFADIGSGKGRVVLQAASRYRFKRVIGVELSKRLTEVARGNLERNRGRFRCRDVELVTTDVLDWEIPDDLSIAYLHNPFLHRVFSSFVERLLGAVERRGRALRLIYVNPVEHERLAAHARVNELPAPRPLLSRLARVPAGAIRYYEILPAVKR